ncbi:MAG: hypothetical protein QNJ88_06430 [Acidimicrobiia bacterium]|nr:hypothetical protein [Acidimicrobiia bacterium]
MISFIVLLIVASILGSIGAAIAGKKETGCLVSIALGFIGAMLGRWISQQLEFSDIWTLTIRDTEIPVFWTIAGSALFVAVLNLLSGRGRPE